MTLAALLLPVLLAGQVVPAAPAGQPAPSVEAVGLGERLARTGTLATLLPLQAAKEADELVAQHPELDASGQARLRSVARATAETMAARLFALEGRTYAELLSEADLRQLVAQAESPAAQRLRAAMPRAIMAVMGGMAGADFKRDTLAAFCRDPAAAGTVTCRPASGRR